MNELLGISLLCQCMSFLLMNMHGFCFTVHSMIYAFLMMLCVKSGSFAPIIDTCSNIRLQVDRIREMLTTENVSTRVIDFSLFLVHF